MDTNSSLFAQYRALEDQFRVLEAEREKLRQQIIDELAARNIQKVKTAFGQFTRAVRLSWQYTDAVNKIEERLKIARLREQKQGKAKSKETYYLIYKQNEKSIKQN